jgi:hypothetical protein
MSVSSLDRSATTAPLVITLWESWWSIQSIQQSILQSGGFGKDTEVSSCLVQCIMKTGIPSTIIDANKIKTAWNQNKNELKKTTKMLQINQITYSIIFNKTNRWRNQKLPQQRKKKNARKVIKPRNSNSLWDAERIAKDTNISSLPKSMYLNENLIPPGDLQDRFE